MQNIYKAKMKAQKSAFWCSDGIWWCNHDGSHEDEDKHGNLMPNNTCRQFTAVLVQTYMFANACTLQAHERENTLRYEWRNKTQHHDVRRL